MNRPIGIDLGTTFSAVAVMDEDGKARVLPDADGKFFTHSVVLFEEDGTITVGQNALDSSLARPEGFVRWFKRYMGDPDWAFHVDGKSYSAEQLSALVLKEMKVIAERHVGPVTQAVITVPAYFMDAAKTATIRAAEQAGLEVLKIINEPTAAALSYGLNEDSTTQTLMVYDLGGGTFDITLMRTRDGTQFETITSSGNHRLGGSDWDATLVDIIALETEAETGQDLRGDAFAFHDLTVKAEKAKIALSKLNEARITCQFQGKAINRLVTRTEFEDLTSHLLAMTEAEVDVAMQSSKLKPQDIDLVLLVGGSSKMPMVDRLMRAKGKSLKLSANPDHCVALGAAIEAARLVSGNARGTGLYKPGTIKRLGDIIVRDKTPHSLGMLAVSGGRLKNEIIIKKDANFGQQYSREDFRVAQDNLTTLTIHLMQGESEDPELCQALASYVFSGIPPRPAAKSRIKVVYQYNDNGVVEVNAVDLASSKDLVKTTRPIVDISSLIAGDTEPKSAGKTKVGTRPRAAALLIDASYSMMGESMEHAKKACMAFIGKTDFRHVKVGLVQFGMDSEASIMVNLSTTPEPLENAVRMLTPSGSTPMAEGIECGMQLLAQEPEREKFIVLFTDGSPDSAASAVDAAHRAKQSGIHLICVGVPGADRELMGRIATSTDENYFAAHGAALESRFGDIAEVISDKRV